MHTLYKQADFIKIVTNFERLEIKTDIDQVIESHKELFSFFDNQAAAFYFIHDFVNFKYVMVSKSLYALLGQNTEDFVGQGFGCVLRFIHPEDRENLRFIHEALFSYFYKQPVRDRGKLRFDFNFRLITSEGVYKQISQQSIFTVLSEGKPLFDFSTCTDISHSKRNNRLELAIHKLNEKGIFERVFEYVVPHTIGFGLSAAEFIILKYAAEGLSSKEIAQECSRSLHTVNNHRRNILHKTQCRTLMEVIQKIEL